MPPKYIKATTLDYPAHTVVRPALERLVTLKPGAMALHKEILGLKFKPVTGAKGVWGTKASWTSSDDETLTFEMNVQSYSKPGQRDQIALLSITVAGPKGENDEYCCYLRAPGGDWGKAVERFADKSNKIRDTHSYWTRAWNCIKANCGKPCLGSISACTGGLAACITGLLTVCGGCAIKCLACAGCRCRWWCKWAVGCCRD